MKSNRKIEASIGLQNPGGAMKNWSEGSGLKMISFTPCSATDSLLEANVTTAKKGRFENVILLSPGRFCLDRFCSQNNGEAFCLVSMPPMATPSCGGLFCGSPNRVIVNPKIFNRPEIILSNFSAFAPGFYEEKPRRKIINQTITPHRN